MGWLLVKAFWVHRDMVEAIEIRIRLAYVCFYSFGN